MGDRHRIPRSTDKKYSDPEFVRTLRDSDNGHLTRNYSRFFTSPAYAHTKAEVGEIKHDLLNV